MLLLSPSEFVLQRLVSLTFYFDFKSESQEEGKCVGVAENGVWEVATRRADASLFGLVSLFQ